MANDRIREIFALEFSALTEDLWKELIDLVSVVLTEKEGEE